MYEKHSVIPAEVIESMNEPHAIIIPAKQDRVMILGRAGKRLLSTVLQKQTTENTYHVVTSRDMSKKERTLYRSQQERV